MRSPIIAERPFVDHPPAFENVIRASLAVALGDRIHSGTITAKSPIIYDTETGDCPNQQRPMPSFKNIGRIVQDNQTLDNCADDEANRQKTGLPS